MPIGLALSHELGEGQTYLHWLQLTAVAFILLASIVITYAEAAIHIRELLKAAHEPETST